MKNENLKLNSSNGKGAIDAKKIEADLKYFDTLFSDIDTDNLLLRDVYDEKENQGSISKDLVLDIPENNKYSCTSFFAVAFSFLLCKFNASKNIILNIASKGKNGIADLMPFPFSYANQDSIKDAIVNNTVFINELKEKNLECSINLFDKYGINDEIRFIYEDLTANSNNSKEIDEAIKNECDCKQIQEPKLICKIFKVDANKYIFNLLYRSDYYSVELMESLSNAYIKALNELLSKERFEDVDISDEHEISKLNSFFGKELNYDKNDTVVSLINKKLNENKNKVAVVSKNRKLTYEEFRLETNKFSNFLIKNGIKEGDAVGILIDRDEYMPILSFAVSKIAATYIPIDPSYPEDRINFTLKDCEAKLVLTLTKYAGKIDKDFKGLIVKIDDELAKSSINDDSDVNIKISPNDRFIMLYTSGTTGTPKGVELLHRNIVAIITHINDVRKNDGEVRAAAYASYGFDANMMDMYPTLVSGGTLYIIPDELRLDLYALRDFYNKNKITHGFMTTQIARQFVELGGHETLKELSTGGEKLISINPPKFRFINVYGPTECSIFITSYIVDKYLKDIPIGHTVSNHHIYIVDELNHRMPAGASGELIVSGPQVGKGYLNRPDKNKEAFRDNPFENVAPYDKAYYTGDIVRFLPDGNIQYVGRRDTQVKVRGFRIELSEVEEVIRRFDKIKDATVVAYDDSAGMKYLVAYVVSNSKVDVKKLNEFILKEKPAYMVPSITMQIDAIPLTQNQKVNKRALPKPEMKTSGDAKKPTNKMQEKIFDIISSVIGNKEFGIDDDIFMLGLNSISVVRLNVLLGKEFDIPIRIGDIKENNTIEKLEKFIDLNKSKNESVVDENKDRYAISKTQEGIFVESIANPGTTIYNLGILIKIKDSIDVKRLENAIKSAIDAHPYLNAIIEMDPTTNEIYAKKNESKEYNIEVKELKHLPEKKSLVKPFSLMGKCLYKIIIFDTSLDGKYLFIDMHHIISDGSSIVVFFNDIDKAYKGQKLEKEKFTGFLYAEEERRLLETDEYEKAKKYYESLLDKADTDSKLTSDDTGRTEKKAAHVNRIINVDRSALEDFCNANGLSLNVLFNAAFGFTFSKYNYKEEVTYATVYNGRNDSRMDNAIYMLVKTLPILCKYDKDTKTLDFLKGYKDQINDNMYNDLYSFQDICRNQHVNANTLFIYQGDNFAFDKFLGYDSELIDIESDTPMEPFKIELNIINGNFIAKAEYRDDLYNKDTIDGFMECMEAVLKEFLVKENLKDISLFTNRTKALIDKFNDTDIPVEHTSEVKVFEKAVEKYNDRVAVIAKDESITFDELNKRANRLAHSLIKEGVGLDNFVGLMIDRCANAYVGRQGIWKSGGAFLSLDPKYPDDRISYIITDSKAKIIITKKEIAEKRMDFLKSLNIKILYIEDLLKNDNDENPNVEISPNNLAYCLYTSGSTGKPKGVMVEHRGVVNLATDSDKSVQVKVFTIDCKVICALAALTFDVSVGEHVIGLLNGLTVAIASEEEITNPLLLCDMIIKNKVDGFTCTPSYINNMLDIKETYPALRQIKGFQVGAETFPKQLLRKMRDNGINGRITNSYGPTEATDYSTTNFIDDENFITIGRALPNYKVYVFDKFGNSLPPKIMGELIISGIGVARGYVGREDLNKEKFFNYNNLLSYKSGDLAKWNYKGTIDFIGRMDNQVKFHGLRIELDEISNVINSYEGVKQSITVVKKDESGDEYLASYFIASFEVNIESLYSHIKKSLTEYMIPTSLMQLSSFPMNANGKVDKSALPEPGKKEEKKDIKAASSELETTILDMFKSALNKTNIGVDDDFFKNGGTSLTVSKIAMKAMTLKIPINYGDVFDYPTVSSLAKLVNERQGNADVKLNEVKTDKIIVNDKTKDTDEVKKALSHNETKFVDEIKELSYGDVVLTGATGFLGIHVLKYLIDNTDKKIYCFLRKGKMSSPVAKLKNYLMYYFDDLYEDLFGKRIFIVSGDITDTESINHLSNFDFDTVFNCAACVKHFGNDDTLYNVNVQGVKNIVDFCVKNKKRLIHVSTASVAGETYEGSSIDNVKLTENILNFGQDISNKYINTKFQAEEIILSNITNNDLKAKIIRVGNLMSRYSDGEFQINSIENAFMKTLRAYSAMKVFPVSSMDEVCEFSPVDCVAETIVKLAGTNDDFTVFLSCNNHFVQMGDVIYAMNKLGANIKVVSDKEYDTIFKQYLSDEKKNEAVSILISYNEGESKKTIFLGYENQFTTKALYRINYRWPIITEDYIEKAIETIMKLGYFNIG